MKKLKDTILEIKRNNNNQFHLSKHKYLTEEILEATRFLNNVSNSERIYCILNNITFIPKCYCGKDLIFNSKTNKYKIYCSRHCQDIDPLKKEKTKKTCLEKYGVENPMLNTFIKNKAIKNNNYSKMVETHKNNFLEKYGVSHPMKLDSVKEKVKKTCLEKYGVENPMLNKDICKKCLTSSPHSSSFENEVYEYIKLLIKSEIKRNDLDILEGRELDIYIKDYNFAIECNGEYFHREDNGKNKSYHLNKTIDCFNKGIRLIHIFESEWRKDNDNIKSLIKNLLFNDINISSGDLLDRRYYSIEDVSSFSYDIIEPQKLYFKSNTLYNEYVENSHIVWNCGFIKVL